MIFFSSNNMFFYKLSTEISIPARSFKINITPGYFMYMFVHIRKVFPKNVFITHHFFFGKLHL